MRPCAGAGLHRRSPRNRPGRTILSSCGSLSRAGRSLPQRRPASVPRRLRPTFRTRRTHRNHRFCILRVIHSSDRPQRLLRATATVRREPWGMPASGRGTGLRPPMPTATTTGPAFASPKPRTVRCTMRIVRAATPCAASKHLPATFEKANFAPEKELKAKGWTENGRNERCGRNPDLPGRRKSCTAQHRIKS